MPLSELEGLSNREIALLNHWLIKSHLESHDDKLDAHIKGHAARVGAFRWFVQISVAIVAAGAAWLLALYTIGRILGS